MGEWPHCPNGCGPLTTDETCPDCGCGAVQDPLLLYQTFQEAVAEWMEENRFRFMIPSREYWPEGVESREESREHYSEQAATEIIEKWERIYNEEVLGDEQ